MCGFCKKLAKKVSPCLQQACSASFEPEATTKFYCCFRRRKNKHAQRTWGRSSSMWLKIDFLTSLLSWTQSYWGVLWSAEVLDSEARKMVVSSLSWAFSKVRNAFLHKRKHTWIAWSLQIRHLITTQRVFWIFVTKKRILMQ